MIHFLKILANYNQRNVSISTRQHAAHSSSCPTNSEAAVIFLHMCCVCAVCPKHAAIHRDLQFNLSSFWKITTNQIRTDSHLLLWIRCSRTFLSKFIFLSVVTSASGVPLLVFLRGIDLPGTEQTQLPIQVRGHERNGITSDSLSADILRQEVVFTD